MATGSIAMASAGRSHRLPVKEYPSHRLSTLPSSNKIWQGPQMVAKYVVVMPFQWRKHRSVGVRSPWPWPPALKCHAPLPPAMYVWAFDVCDHGVCMTGGVITGVCHDRGCHDRGVHDRGCMTGGVMTGGVHNRGYLSTGCCDRGVVTGVCLFKRSCAYVFKHSDEQP